MTNDQECVQRGVFQAKLLQNCEDIDLFMYAEGTVIFLHEIPGGEASPVVREEIKSFCVNRCEASTIRDDYPFPYSRWLIPMPLVRWFEETVRGVPHKQLQSDRRMVHERMLANTRHLAKESWATYFAMLTTEDDKRACAIFFVFCAGEMPATWERELPVRFDDLMRDYTDRTSQD